MHIPDKTLENFSDNDKMNTDEMIAFLNIWSNVISVWSR